MRESFTSRQEVTPHEGWKAARPFLLRMLGHAVRPVYGFAVRMEGRSAHCITNHKPMQNDRFLLPSAVLTQEMSDGEIVLLHVTEGQYFTLNRTGSHIWQLLVEGHTPHGAAEAIAEHYDVDLADALLSVLKLTHELKRSGLLIEEAA